MTDWDAVTLANIRYLQRHIHEWANSTFPEREFKTTMAKLVLEEIPEWVQNPEDPMEFADLIILILDLASMQDIDVAEAVRNKMEVNENRTWEKDKTGLFYRHVNEPEEYGCPMGHGLGCTSSHK